MKLRTSIFPRQSATVLITLCGIYFFYANCGFRSNRFLGTADNDRNYSYTGAGAILDKQTIVIHPFDPGGLE
jgi:hypothetical protein